ncbi:MAG: C-type lectin domain-containing protein [Polyangiaceae bacterium]|nr:C-type lectin domain-containing protein [Polyangiaceae bacterium]
MQVRLLLPCLALGLALGACALETSGTGRLLGTGGGPSGGSSLTGGTGGDGASTGGVSPGVGGADPNPACGDGYIAPGEDCDPADEESVPGCLDCRLDPTHPPVAYGTPLANEDGRVHYYFANQTRSSFDDAERGCQSVGAHLAVIHSDAEQTLVAELGSIFGEFWIGARDVSSSLTGLTWVAWEGDVVYEPPSGVVFDSSAERCVTISVAEDNAWLDRDCATSFPSVCEWEVPGIPW